MSAPDPVQATAPVSVVNARSQHELTDWFDQRYAVIDMGTPIYDQLLYETQPAAYLGRHAWTGA